MCSDPQIFLEVQIISLSLQTCENYGATMIWSGQSNYRYIGMGCLYVRLLGALVLCETLETYNKKSIIKFNRTYNS